MQSWARVLVGAAVLAFVCLPKVEAQDKAQVALDELARATTLSSPDTKPWHLHMTFTLSDAYGKPDDAGALDAWWDGREQRTSVESTKLHGAFPSEDAAYKAGLTREVYLIHLLLAQTTRPVPSYASTAKLVYTESDRNFGKATLHCLRVAHAKADADDQAPGSAPEFCVAKDNPDMLRVRFDSGGLSVARNRIAKFQGLTVSLNNTLAYSARVAIVGDVSKLESWDGQGAPAASDGDEVSHVQGVVVAARRTGGAPPTYPKIALDKDQGGQVVCAAKIDEKGHVVDLVEIASPQPVFTGAAEQAFSTWTFQPFTVNGVPQAVWTTLTMRFRYRGR